MSRPPSSTMPMSFRGRHASVPEMRLAHQALIQRRRLEQAGQLQEAIVEFLKQWQSVGELLLETMPDHRDAQGMLDYWVAELYRVFGKAPDVELALFSEPRVQQLLAFADAWFSSFPADEQKILSRMFVRLIRFEPGKETILRQRSTVSFVLGPTPSPNAAPLFESMLREGFVVATTGASSPAQHVELAHLVLAERWPPFLSWIEDERGRQRRRQAQRTAAEVWDSRGRNDDYLLGGALLREAENIPDLNDLEKLFVQRSRDAVRQYEQEERAREEALAEEKRKRLEEARWRQVWLSLTIASAVVGVIVLVLTIALAILWQKATEAKSIAEVARDQADKLRASETEAKKIAEALEAVRMARTQFDVDTGRALLLGLRGADLYPPSDNSRPVRRAVEDLLFQGMQVSRNTHVLTDPNPENRKRIFGVAYGPKGMLAVAVDRRVEFWNLPAGATRPTPTGNHKGTINWVAFNHDGSLLAAASDDSTIRLWSPTAEEIVAELRGHNEQVWAVAFCPRLRDLLVSGGTDRKVLVWEPGEKGQWRSRKVGEDHLDAVTSVSLSPEGNLAASASLDGVVQICDTQTGKTLLQLPRQEAGVLAVAFAPLVVNGHLVLGAAGIDGVARVWTLVQAPGQTSIQATLLFTLSGHQDWIRSLTFHPLGDRLVTASQDGTARVWFLNWRTKSARELLTLSDHTGGLTAVAYHPNREEVATTSFDGTTRLWQVGNVDQVLDVHLGHDRSVYSVSYDPKGRFFVTGSADKTVKIWQKGKTPRTFQHGAEVRAVAVAPDGSRVVSVGNDFRALIWDPEARDEKPVGTLSLARGDAKASPVTIWSVAFDSSGRYLATGCDDGTIGLWSWRQANARNPEKEERDPALKVRLRLREDPRVYALAFEPKQGQLLATGDGSGRVGLWGVEECLACAGKDEKEERDPLALFIDDNLGNRTHRGRVYAVGFSPDGKLLASGGEDRTIKVWDIASRKLVKRIEQHDRTIYSLAFTPDGQGLVSASADHTTRWIDLDSGETLRTLIGHNSAVYSAAVHPLGNQVAAAAFDGGVYVYHLGEITLQGVVKRAKSQLPREWPEGTVRQLTNGEKTRFHVE